MDAIELLEQDHRRVESLFGHYDQTPEGRQRRELVEVMITELSKHAAVEELIFYPIVKQLVPGGAALIDESLDEHMRVKILLHQLDQMGPDDPGMGDAVKALQREIEHHVQEEERQTMPRLREVLDADALAAIGEELAKAKEKAPTRPHPKAPDQPPALAMAAPVAALIDRLKDRIQGRPSL